MISKIRTCLVAILAAATVVTSVPVYATDTKVDTNIETVENQPSDSEQIEENQVQNAIEQHLNYLYIESPYVETPATQRIVVSWGDGTENIEEIDLSVEHNGDTQTWTSVKSEDGVFLYEKAYADGEDGIYTITKLTVKTAEMETSYLLSDLGMEAKFGVNETYEGMSELQPIEGQPDAEAATDEEQYDVAVMSIDEDGNVMEESSIEDALEKAEVEEYGSDEDIQTYAEDNARAVDDSRAVNKNVVVALDPGHDSTHTGAGANGVREEVLTLKIAKYCKEELEKYANVSVYMTRTTAACPYPSNKNSGGDISDRVYAAAKAGASIFVSFHLNSSTSTSAKGAEVIVPNDSWKPEVAQQGKELANDIMDELTAIGLQKRSIYSKDTTLADEKYPDGSKSDYFSVQIAAKENNIPGIIVEHAFVTNTGDVNTYLNNEAGLKKLGVADATGIAKYLGVSKEKGTWVEDSNGWKYKEGGGSEDEGELEKWLRTIKEILDDPQPDAMDFLDTIKLNLFASEIFVFTPKGEIKTMPQNCTALDFAFSIHTFLGSHCIGAKVNHKLVPLSHKLQSGDQVEILTSKSQHVQPSWINFATTAKAKAKIQAILKREQRGMQQAGEEMLREFFSREGVEYTPENIRKICNLHTLKTQEELFAAIGFKTIILGENDKNELKDKPVSSNWKKYISFAFGGSKTNKEKPTEEKVPLPKIDSKKILKLTPEAIQKNYVIAECCKPIPGDDVLGYIGDNNRIIIHKRQCPLATKLKSSYGNRLLAVQWETGKSLYFPVNIYIKGIDHIGLLNKVTEIISQQLNVNIHKLNIESNDGIFEGRIQLFVHDVDDVKSITTNLRKIDEIKTVTRIEKFEDQPN